MALAAAVAATATASAPSAGAAAAGKVYGGLTSNAWPVVVEVNATRRRVVRAGIGLRLNCTSGGFYNTPDGYRDLTIRRGRFSASFGPQTIRNPDGTTSDLEGSLSGSFNAARTKISGRWQLKVTEHDAAGAVTDTCDSGSVSWTARQ
jgi:hypothetical protein